MDKLFQQVNSYFEKYGGNATVALKTDEKFIMVSPRSGIAAYPFEGGLEGEAEVVRGVLKNKKSVNALILSSQNYTSVVSQTAATLPPILDDLAQIVGPSVRCSKTMNVVSLLMKLGGRNACFIMNNGALAAGRTLDEADTATQVLEKGCKAFIESAMIGGARPIRRIEAALMHIIYKKKYSKLDQQTKLKEIQNERK